MRPTSTVSGFVLVGRLEEQDSNYLESIAI
jgi:hypothetical protein